ncbi:hypothetical protein KJ918_04220 [Patescibacteria group bacterium]|nr:hypothetical protein [Patescibacteria group bacterium]
MEIAFSWVKKDGRLPPFVETINRFTILQTVTILIVLIISIADINPFKIQVLIGMIVIVALFLILLWQARYYDTQRDEMKKRISESLEEYVVRYKGKIDKEFLVNFAMEYLDIDYDPNGIANKIATPKQYKRNKRGRFYLLLQNLAEFKKEFNPEEIFLPSPNEQKKAKNKYFLFLILSLIGLGLYAWIIWIVSLNIHMPTI